MNNKKTGETHTNTMFSRRWNRIVRNLLHIQIFKPNKDAINKEKQDESKFITPPCSPALDDALNENAPVKKRGAKGTIKKTITTTTTVTTTKRVTRAAAAAAAKAKAIEAEANEIKTQAEIYAESTDNDDNEYDAMIPCKKSTAQTLPLKESFWATRSGKGLLSFIVSGVFHELIIMSTCRHITLENLVFFTLQGFAVMIEVAIRQGSLKQEPAGIVRVLCIALQLVFMSITGRLFTGPFLRYHFFPENLAL